MIHFAVYSVSEMIILKTFALKRKGKERRVLARESCTGSHGVTPPPQSDLEVIQGHEEAPEAEAGAGRAWPCRRHSAWRLIAAQCSRRSLIPRKKGKMLSFYSLFYSSVLLET